MNQFLGLLIIVIIAYPAKGYPDPGKTSQWLINSPVSLMDWGVFHAEKDLKESVRNIEENTDMFHHLGSFAAYDWEEDEIQFIVRVEYKDITHTGCKIVRKALINDLRGGEHNKWDYLPIRMEGWFSNEGFRRCDQPEDIGKKLMNIT